MDLEDREITLGLGRMLGLFFLLVAVCGVFLSIGYSLGKSTAREQALNDEPTQVLAAAPPGADPTGSSAGKAFRGGRLQARRGAAGQEQATAPNPQNNLTFYKAVQQNGTAYTSRSAKDSAPAAPCGNSERKSSRVSSPRVYATDQRSSHPGYRPASPVTSSTPVTGPGTIVVQIAALTREDDAVALAGALRKKDYNVIVVKNPAVNDKFYHVQVGPFTTMAEADAMKAKLVAEGYNPIVKR